MMHSLLQGDYWTRLEIFGVNRAEMVMVLAQGPSVLRNNRLMLLICSSSATLLANVDLAHHYQPSNISMQSALLKLLGIFIQTKIQKALVMEKEDDFIIGRPLNI